MATANKHIYIGLDLGEKRIGVALGDSAIGMASPLSTVQVDGTEIIRLQRVLLEHDATDLVVGLPRNSEGAETRQSQLVREFVKLRLEGLAVPIHFQDESATSVIAEQRLQARGKPYAKGDIDAEAASIVLQDFLELHRG